MNRSDFFAAETPFTKSGCSWAAGINRRHGGIEQNGLVCGPAALRKITLCYVTLHYIVYTPYVYTYVQ